jgi:hypothetical protein
VSVLGAIEAAALGECEHAGIRWRVRRVNSRLVSDVRLRLLRMQVPTEAEQLQEEAARSITDEGERKAALARLATARLLARVDDPATVARSRELDAAMLAAGVVACWDDDTGGWLPVRLVADGEAIDREAVPPRVPMDVLPAGTDTALVRAIWSLSTDGEAAAERVRSFRGGP